MDYSEEQKLNSPIVLIVFAIGAIGAFAGVGFSLFEARENEENVYNLIWLPFFLLAIEGFVYYMVFQTELQTWITRDGFTYKYFPIVRKQKTISFDEIISWKIYKAKKFNFNGFGYRKDIFSKKTGFFMGSLETIELKSTSGKTFLFSTTNTAMLFSAMKKYASNKEIS